MSLNWDLRNFFKDVRSVIVTSIIVIVVVFFLPIDTLVCAGGICKCYHQTGTIGFKTLQYQFRVDDILYHTYKTDPHRVRRTRRSYSTHTDYSPVLHLKDGRTIELPLQFCYNQNKADEFLQAIKSKKYTKKSNFRFLL